MSAWTMATSAKTRVAPVLMFVCSCSIQSDQVVENCTTKRLARFVDVSLHLE